MPISILYLLLMLPIAAVAAPTPTSTASPIEAAVLHMVGGRMVALPVLSFPIVSQQFPDNKSEGGFADRMEAPDDMRARILKKCAEKNPRTVSENEWGCAIPTTIVTQHHHMRFTPRQWLDSTGSKYPTLGGWYFESPGGTGIGIDLGPIRSDTAVLAGRVLLSDASGFPITTPIAPSDWKRWPELTQDLAGWAKPELIKCGQAMGCRQTVKQLAAPARLKGNAREFRLSDGRKLQYLSASSQSEGRGVLAVKPYYIEEGQASMEPDTLKIDLWRIVTRDGKARVLRLGEEHTFSGTKLVDPYCETQCSRGWDGLPDVFTARGRIFVFGPDGGGTASGYVFLEVMPTELRFLGSYVWGS